MAKDPAFPFYAGDFIMGTALMTNEQVGIYIKLLCIQHQHGGLIDKTSFNSMVNGFDLLRSKFIETEDGFFNKRLMEEMEKRQIKSTNLSANANIRWNAYKKKMQLQCKSNASAMPPEIEIEDNTSKTTKQLYINTKYDFDALWAKYPRKIGKYDAQRHFNAQIKSIEDHRNIIKALDNFLQSDVVKGEAKFIPHGSTWFNNRWRDYLDIQVATGKSQALIDMERMIEDDRKRGVSSIPRDGA